MTPPSLDAASVHAKLRLMRELLDDLESLGEVPPPGSRATACCEYAVIDLTLVAGSIPLAREGYRAYVRAVASFLAE